MVAELIGIYIVQVLIDVTYVPFMSPLCPLWEGVWMTEYNMYLYLWFHSEPKLRYHTTT